VNVSSAVQENNATTKFQSKKYVFLGGGWKE